MSAKKSRTNGTTERSQKTPEEQARADAADKLHQDAFASRVRDFLAPEREGGRTSEDKLPKDEVSDDELFEAGKVSRDAEIEHFWFEGNAEEKKRLKKKMRQAQARFAAALRFKGELRVTHFLWDRMLKGGPDEETGDSKKGPYWAGLLKGPLTAGIEEKLSPPEHKFLDRQAGAILMEGTIGTVTGKYYQSKEALEKAWDDAVKYAVDSGEDESP